MLAALIAFFLGTTVQGDGPFRPNDVVHKNFFTTTIERGPVVTHDCTNYKAVGDSYIYVDCGQKAVTPVPLMANPVMTKTREAGGFYWITHDYDGFKADCTRRGANLVSRLTVNGKEYPVCVPKTPHRQLDKWN